ncbi:MAG: DegV family protein, partial [Anaerolineae bacterium]
SLVDLYDSLIFITVSSEMSGTNNVIRRELENIDPQGKKVTVIDSLVNSGAEGLLVKTAADMLNQGANHDDVVARVRQLVPRTKIYVCLETLQYAVRSGRVPNTVGRIGIRLRLRPIMSIDASGKGTAFGAAFSRAGITKRIHRLVRKRMVSGGIQSYAIVHVDNQELADQYRRQLTAMIGREPEFVTEVSSVIAIHSGPGSVAVCLIENEEAPHA